jgi:hypothetical protein
MMLTGELEARLERLRAMNGDRNHNPVGRERTSFS